MLVDEPADQRGLKQECRYRCQDWHSILLPHGRAELYAATRRQNGFTDVPTLKLPPIVHGCGQSHRRHLDIASGFTVEDSHGNLCALLAYLKAGKHRAADDTLPKMAIDMGEDRHPPQLDKPKEHNISLLCR